jgi:hypothetical protein
LIGSGSAFLLPRVPRNNPLLEARWPQFDTTFCQTTECRTLELENVGDTVVTVQTLDFIPPPFSGSETVPFSIAPGETKSITVCYRPPDAPRLDTLQLGFSADIRAPQRIALFFDESASMGEGFMPGLSRLLAASAGATDFANGMEFSAGSTDAVTIAGFDTAGVLRWNGTYFTDRDSLRAALPDSASNQISCPYDAINRLLTGLDGLHREPETVILFTAGEDGGTLCGPVTSTELASNALAMGVRIHCVQLGDADSTALIQLVQSTGGRFLRPQTLLDLILGLRDLESEFSRSTTIRHQSIARGVTPIIQVDRDTINCGVYYSRDGKSSKAGRVNISNVGDAPLLLIEDEGLGPAFRSGDGGTVISLTHREPGDSLIIPPGWTGRWSVNFLGREDRAYTDTLILLHNACMQSALEIPVIGRMIVVPNESWVFPAGVNIPSLLDLGTVPCGGEHCRDVALRNPGAAQAEIAMSVGPDPPFSTTVQGPFTVSGGDSLLIPFCYRPSTAGQHSQWLEFQSETTQPRSTVLVLPEDASAFDTVSEGTTFRYMRYFAQMKYALQMHPDSLGPDESAVMAFNSERLDTLLEFTSVGWRVASASYDSSVSAPGNLFMAMNAAMDYAASNAKGRKLVIAIVNDANAMSPTDAVALRDRAAREDVILAIAALGKKGYTMLSPTAGTAARFDSCFTLAALERFIYETTRTAVVTVRDSMYLSGTAVEGKLDVDPLALDFGAIRVSGDACLPVTIRNSGDAPLTLVDVINPVEPFPTVFPPILDAGQESQVELCFAASRLGSQSADVLFIYDGCRRDTMIVRLTANGFDSVNVGINATVRGMPGHVVRIPVQLFGAVPFSYNVRSYELTLSYNKTMLYPLLRGAVSDGTVTSRMSSSSVVLTQRFASDSQTGTATYEVSGSYPLWSDGVSDTLLSPPFLVLHGDALQTQVRVTSIRFSDGSPAAGIAVAGTFISDSLCFQEERLIDASARYNASIMGGYPNPFNPVATISYSLREGAQVRLSVHDALGRELRVIDEGNREAGLHRARFDASGLPTGVYFYRLESGDELLSGSLLYLK